MFPKLVAIHGAEHEMIRDAFEFGFLDVIYPSPENLKEISLIPDEKLKNE